MSERKANQIEKRTIDGTTAECQGIDIAPAFRELIALFPVSELLRMKGALEEEKDKGVIMQFAIQDIDTEISKRIREAM